MCFLLMTGMLLASHFGEQVHNLEAMNHRWNVPLTAGQSAAVGAA